MGTKVNLGYPHQLVQYLPDFTETLTPGEQGLSPLCHHTFVLTSNPNPIQHPSLQRIPLKAQLRFYSLQEAIPNHYPTVISALTETVPEPHTLKMIQAQHIRWESVFCLHQD